MNATESVIWLMKLRKIKLTDFRCFKEYEIGLKSGVNLLIGENGSGKTSVIRGVTLALNAFFKGFSDENTSCAGIASEDFCHSVANESKSLTRPAEVLFSTISGEENVSIFRKSKKTSTIYQNAREFNWKNKDLYSKVAEEDGDHRQTPLPLFAFFATDDIHLKYQNVEAKSFKDYYLAPSFGYYLCLRGGFLAKYWVNRMLVLEEGGKGEEELEIVRNAIRTALGNDGCGIINDVTIRPKQGYVYFIFTDGREVRFEDLSDGYMRLVNMVIDLAFRCSILNRPLFGLQACSRTEGVVCVDEIDDHLHPSLQAKVIKGLKLAFPGVQFVISTHAPMVMSSVMTNEENEVLHLGYRDGTYMAMPINTYGLDASTILEMYMGKNARVAEVEERLKELFDLIDNDYYPEAKAKLRELTNDFGDALPEIIQARTMLDFRMESDDKD